MSEIQKWADPAMFEAPPIKTENKTGMAVHLLWMTPDPAGAVAAACRMYEGKPTYSLEEITDDERRRYMEQVQRTKLQAPFEFVHFHFFIEGVSRAFTHQMVRQRTAVYAQESLRFAVKENFLDEVYVPPSLHGLEEDDPARVEWDEAVEHIQHSYTRLIEMGIPAEDARGLLPHAIKTRLHYRTDLRALLDHMGNRLCTQAQYEWKIYAANVVQAIRQHPEGHWFEGMFEPVCIKAGKCQFDADFDRYCSLRERLDAGRPDLIKEEEWLLNPRAAIRPQ